MGSCNTPHTWKFLRGCLRVTVARVAQAGYHDVEIRWDLSTPERVVARLAEKPKQGPWPQPGRTLFAERDRFGGWHHLLGDHQLVGHSLDHPGHGLIRRLTVQTHLGGGGEELANLCSVDDFPRRWLGLEQRMALYGVLPASEPRVVRADVAVDVEYDDPADGLSSLQAVKHARWPNGWHTEFQGPPPYTTVAVKLNQRIVASVYCRATKMKTGERWSRLRFEVRKHDRWPTARPVSALENVAYASMIWGTVFGLGRPSGTVTRLAREVQTVKLIDRVQLGEISYAQFERMTAFLDAERLGMVDRVYTPEQARSRRREAKALGLSASDAEYVEFDAALDDLLAVPRSAFAA